MLLNPWNVHANIRYFLEYTIQCMSPLHVFTAVLSPRVYHKMTELRFKSLRNLIRLQNTVIQKNNKIS